MCEPWNGISDLKPFQQPSSHIKMVAYYYEPFSACEYFVAMQARRMMHLEK
jgi:hypothetical protein